MYYLWKHSQLLPGYQAGERKNPGNLSNSEGREGASERANGEAGKTKTLEKPNVLFA